MYSFAYDKPSATLVGIYSGGSSADADFESDQAAGNRLVEEAARSKLAAVWIVVMEAGHRRPTASQRRIIVEGRKTTDASVPLYLAIVNPSVLIRGFVNAVNWIAPLSPSQTICCVPTFDHALLWAEKQRGELLPVLRTLFATARKGTSGP